MELKNDLMLFPRQDHPHMQLYRYKKVKENTIEMRGAKERMNDLKI